MALVLFAAVLAGWALRPAMAALAFWSDPILLQFVLGMGVPMLRAQAVAPNGALRLALALAGPILSVSLPAEWPRGLRFTPGAGLLVAAATLGPEPRLPDALARWIVQLGNASYALYLAHPSRSGP
jgi:exopolysaccharide production protein ExoZ